MHALLKDKLVPWVNKNPGSAAVAIIATAVALVGFRAIFGSKKSNLQKSFVAPNQTPKPDHGEVHTSTAFNGEVVGTHKDFPGITTVYDVFQYAVKKYPKNKYLGWRENGGDYKWLTYEQTSQKADALGSGLYSLCDLKKGQFVGIFSSNRVEWTITERACINHNIVTVPLYDTLGEEAMTYIMTHCEIPLVICSQKETAKLLKSASQCPSLKTVVQMEDLKNPEEDKKNALAGGITLYSMNEVMKAGEAKPVQHTPPVASDTHTICFTSGTTGKPKGAVLTHENFVTCIFGAIHHGVFSNPTDTHISYLPLAHIFERLVQAILTLFGSAIGFYQGEIIKLFDDIAVLRPTIFCGVPRVFNRIYDKIMMQVNESPKLNQYLLKKALADKLKGLNNGTNKHALWDTLVFNKVKKALGGRVRLLVSGSAPLSEDVLKFMRVAFSAEFVEGYGMTESMGATCTTVPGDFTKGYGPFCSTAVKLVSVPEMNYFVTDKPHPRGEVCFKGPLVFKGYYKDEENTKLSLDEEGWLHTGDVGMWLEDGSLKIIDRKKNIFKLSQGEYIAPDKIEGIYVKSQFVAQVFIYGDSYQSTLVGIVVPDFEVLQKWVSQNKPELSSLSKPELCTNQDIKKLIFTDMKKTAVEGGLKGFEQLVNIYLEPKMFSIDNNLLTPTMKPKRPELKAYYQSQINDLYAAGVFSTK